MKKEHENKFKNMRGRNGITLIALVITIIVLLILAGVSIATLTGENGILTRANDTKGQTEIASVKEQAQLDIANWIAERLQNNEDITLDDSTIKSIIETANASNSNKYYKELQSDKIITPSGYEILYSELYTNGNGGNGGGTETGNLPSTDETSPFLPDGATPTNTDWNTGITIKDSNNNEWTWIVVPKSVTVSATNDEQIEEALIGYATRYRGSSSYLDEYYEDCGLSQQDYIDNYSKMLQSIKEYGGFYIGKYEVGSFDEPVTSKDNTRNPVIQKGAYPYNYVECQQAENLAEGLATGGKTSSLLFGIQWDLVLKYLEQNGVKVDELITDSGLWGNYKDVSFSVSEGNRYAIYNQQISKLGDWNNVPNNYTKKNEGTENIVLLSTGATDRNSKLNIYDLAGNVYEWTLEKNTGSSNICVNRGGFCSNNGSVLPVYIRNNSSSSYNAYHTRISCNIILISLIIQMKN